jgi:hypothetical protein
MFEYFGYGSNLNLASLRAKGVVPLSSRRGVLPGWQLRFSVRHWFRHEGGVGNIRPTASATDRVLGVVHRCEDEHLAMLDQMEAYGIGYDRIEVTVETEDGPVRAFTYVGLPAYVDDTLLPSRRYLNIVLAGAVSSGLEPAYVDWLRSHPVVAAREYPPFDPPPGAAPVFDAASLAAHPDYTALCGAVFDTTGSRTELITLNRLFAGRDATLFHLRRLDGSDGTESLEDLQAGRLTEAAKRYLNAYLHEYAAEFRYVGRYSYD